MFPTDQTRDYIEEEKSYVPNNDVYYGNEDDSANISAEPEFG